MSQPRVVVAGHLCLDILPGLRPLTPEALRALLQPGHLLEVGPAVFTAGGAVANTGLVLHRLGMPVRLVGKIGPDVFGKAVKEILASFDPSLLEGIQVDQDVQTSYTIILDTPGVDRIFIHSMGANAGFGPEDTAREQLRDADLFHFGYPPLMKRMYLNGGEELVEILKTARETGATTSLDLSLPDPASDSGRADWPGILQASLPYTDLFLPSFTELLFILRPALYQALVQEDEEIAAGATPELLSELGTELLEMGVKILLIKLGERGLYLRTAAQPAMERSRWTRQPQPDAWANLELWKPAYQVQEAGTTGAGDAAVAGFLSAFLRGLSPAESLSVAAAMGACRVEAAGALHELPGWTAVQGRIQARWAQRPLQLESPGWSWDAREAIWTRPAG